MPTRLQRQITTLEKISAIDELFKVMLEECDWMIDNSTIIQKEY